MTTVLEKYSNWLQLVECEDIYPCTYVRHLGHNQRLVYNMTDLFLIRLRNENWLCITIRYTYRKICKSCQNVKNIEVWWNVLSDIYIQYITGVTRDKVIRIKHLFYSFLFLLSNWRYIVVGYAYLQYSIYKRKSSVNSKTSP